MHCKLIPIEGKNFRGKQVYHCQHCGLTLGLENPETRIICRVLAAKEPPAQLLTKRIYHSEDRIDANNLGSPDDLQISKGASLRDKVYAIMKSNLTRQAKSIGRIAPNKDNTAAEKAIDEQAKNYAEKYIKEQQEGKLNDAEAQKEYMCSKEEIDARLAICDTCEYYENNTCLQCGCAISRNAVHSNKLAYKHKSCPVGKWGPIPITEPENQKLSEN